MKTKTTKQGRAVRSTEGYQPGAVIVELGCIFVNGSAIEGPNRAQAEKGGNFRSDFSSFYPGLATFNLEPLAHLRAGKTGE